VKSVLAAGYRTGDIYVGEGTKVGCMEMGNLVVDAV
jgi:3-isopropylmalate dehydrogenase